MLDISLVRQPGYVDFYGYHTIAGGWLICAWLSNDIMEKLNQSKKSLVVQLTFEQDVISGEYLFACFHRDDLVGRGIGVIFFLAGTGRLMGRLLSADLSFPLNKHHLRATDQAVQLREADITARLKPILGGSFPTDARTEFLGLLSRRGYAGDDTLDKLSDFVDIHIDEAIICPPCGVLLIGWYLCAPGVLQNLKVRSGINVALLNQDKFVKIERADVLEAIGRFKGLTDVRCGFMTYLPDIRDGNEPMFIQVETKRWEIGFKNIPEPKLRGIAAMRRILEAFEVTYQDVRPAIMDVVSPAIASISKEILRHRPVVTEITFGTSPVSPINTIIVPLYGRMDFFEYQFGLMATNYPSIETELIYILDDPSKRGEIQNLAQSVFSRFSIPFRLLLLSENVGFAPANNIALSYATGHFVCFLNSDVFTEEPDWVGKLTARLDADAMLGIVGPQLLFEDGSVQHEGMEFSAIPSLGDMLFPRHIRKGWRPLDVSGLIDQKLITGACMVMRRQLALEIGGFDEAYVIGDFEDTDMCLKVGLLGLKCGVDHDVNLYHLERKSQQGTSGRWRMNLTLCNAWTHQSRWFEPSFQVARESEDV